MLPELGLVLDAGTGMFRVRDLIQTPTLDIFLTHVHLDHSIGLTFLYDVLYQKQLQRVTAHVDADKIDAIRQHLFAVDLFPVQPNFEIVPLQAGEVRKLRYGSHQLTLKAIPVEHPGGCFAFRIDHLPGNRSLAYVTDTTADSSAAYVREIADVHTLIHECYFPDGWEERALLTGHSCLTPVAEVARAANVERCYLVHISPLIESEPVFDLSLVNEIFPRLTIPDDLQVIDI
jgi:ribonuclease BN (tRNA processing enzyme)